MLRPTQTSPIWGPNATALSISALKRPLDLDRAIPRCNPPCCCLEKNVASHLLYQKTSLIPLCMLGGSHHCAKGEAFCNEARCLTHCKTDPWPLRTLMWARRCGPHYTSVRLSGAQSPGQGPSILVPTWYQEQAEWEICPFLVISHTSIHTGGNKQQAEILSYFLSAKTRLCQSTFTSLKAGSGAQNQKRCLLRVSDLTKTLSINQWRSTSKPNILF